MVDLLKLTKSPLSIADFDKIESSGLSLISKHRIRLLAHCLSCFKEVTQNSSMDGLPSKQMLLKWILQQSSLANDREFVDILLEQFLNAERHLEKLAIECNVSPLELTLDNLLEEGFRSRE